MTIEIEQFTLDEAVKRGKEWAPRDPITRTLIEGVGELRDALRELYEWYDRDGSVGAAANVFEKHRALLAQRIEHEPSKLGVEGSNPSERAIARAEAHEGQRNNG